jgi:hypothetical protein
MILFFYLISSVLADEPNLKLIKSVEDKFLPPPAFGEPPKYLEPRRPLPVQGATMEMIANSPLHQKSIPRLAQLIDVKTNEVNILSRNAIVEVHELIDAQNFCYIVNKDKQITHRVQANQVFSINYDVAMYEEPRIFDEIKQRRNISPHDRDLQWYPEVMLSMGLTNSVWTSDIVNDTSARSGTGYLIGGRYMANIGDKFELGAVAQIENTQHTFEMGVARYRNYSFGLAGKSSILEWGGFAWRLIGEFRIGPTGQLVIQTPQFREEVSLRTTTTVLGWERVFKNRFGNWTWGISWQRDWPKLRSQNVEVSKSPSESTNDLIGLNFTQGFVW